MVDWRRGSGGLVRKERREGTEKYWEEDGSWSTPDIKEEFFLGNTVDVIRAPVSGLGVHSAITWDEGWEEKKRVKGEGWEERGVRRGVGGEEEGERRGVGGEGCEERGGRRGVGGEG